jgi:hypothetical protein
MNMKLESTKEESQQGQDLDNDGDGGDRAEEGSRMAGVILQ